MEFFKEVSMFGFNVLKAKKGFRINEEEMEKAEEVLKYAIKTVNKVADVVNENNLSEPISNGTGKISLSFVIPLVLISFICVVVLLFSDKFINDIIAVAILYLLSRIMIFLCVFVLLIYLFLFYAFYYLIFITKMLYYFN